MFEQNGHPSPVLNGSIDTLDREIHSHLNKLNVEFQNFYGIQPTRVDRRFPVNLSDLTYLPKVFPTLLRSNLMQGMRMTCD